MRAHRLQPHLLVSLVAGLVGHSLLTRLHAEEPSPPATVRFESHIAPLLETRCVKCHGDGKLEAGFNVRRRATMIAGGDSGPAIVIGKPDDSLLVQRIEKGEMPPKDDEPLTDAQKKLVRAWIAAGAPLVAAEEKPLDDQDVPSRLTDEDRRFWSFVPPVRHALPTVRQQDRVRTPIDVWITAAQEAQQLHFNDDAAKSAFLRRVSIDLTGLNPDLDQLDDFLADDRPDGVERLVDRLLASPRYGERWGRHWLDIAGYADSDGYLAADRVRPQAWRYRDYVVQATNEDLPYDQFLREQLAGDELTDWRKADAIPPAIERQLIATGFLRTASDPTYPGYTEPNEIHQVLSDTMQIVGSTFLGLTIQCARCHAHKFDPISQRDYYALQAVFLPALDPARWQPSEVRGISLATDRQVAKITQANQQADQRIAEINKSIAELTARFKQQRIRESLAKITNQIHDPFSAPNLDSEWIVQMAAGSKSWKYSLSGERLHVDAIDGKPGYAMVRLSRPVLLEGDFAATLRFDWTSQEGPADKNVAMQGVILNLRDAAGNLVASCGYIDENNTARGSPISGISTKQDALGPDVVAHHMRLYNQAIPPSERARALDASGKAAVAIRRDANGRITTHYDDGRIREELTHENSTPVTSVEIEFRRFVLVPGATFEGVGVDEFQLTANAGSRPSTEKLQALEAALLKGEKERTDEQKQLVAQLAPSIPATEADLAKAYPEFQQDLAKLKADVAAQAALKRDIPKVRGLIDLDGEFPPGRILRRGDHARPGATVEVSVPEVLGGSATSSLAVVPQGKSSGRRKALADWLAHPDHPLTGRVQMNRLWAKHFGRGLVVTTANFGRSGVKPTHAELLDWLATELPRREWSLKSMHRLLLTSTVYRQSSDLSVEQAQRDPKNQWWSAFQPKRHEGEVVRDNALYVAGKLNLAMGGTPSAVAPQGDGSVLTADDAAGNRRSIYLMVRRSQHLTMLDLFDTPMMEVNCPDRNSSIVPLQALALLHGPVSQQAAVALGERLWQSADNDDGRIELAFRLLLSRSPRERERTLSLEFVNSVVREALGSAEVAANDPKLETARRAAWKELALTLLNSNEFLYVH